MRQSLWFLFFYLSLSGWAGNQDATTLLQGHYQRNCELLSFDQKFKKVFPGRFCLFLDDGHLVSADREGLKMYDKNQLLLWEVPGHFHHQINFSTDKKYILALSYHKHSTHPETVVDHFLKIDLKGEIVSEQNAEFLFKQVGFDFPKWSMHESFHRFGFRYERSHFNSIYEVPSNLKSSDGGIFTPGSIIVNSLRAGIFILDPEMKKIVHHEILKNSEDHNIHDVQMLPSGEVLVFNNRNIDDPKGPYSSIDLWRISPGKPSKMTYRYTASEKQWFFSASAGAVQLIDDSYFLITHRLNGIFLVDKKTKKLIFSNPHFATGDHLADLYELQDIKKVDVEKFLKNWSL